MKSITKKLSAFFEPRGISIRVTNVLGDTLLKMAGVETKSSHFQFEETIKHFYLNYLDISLKEAQQLNKFLIQELQDNSVTFKTLKPEDTNNNQEGYYFEIDSGKLLSFLPRFEVFFQHSADTMDYRNKSREFEKQMRNELITHIHEVNNELQKANRFLAFMKGEYPSLSSAKKFLHALLVLFDNKLEQSKFEMGQFQQLKETIEKFTKEQETEMLEPVDDLISELKNYIGLFETEGYFLNKEQNKMYQTLISPIALTETSKENNSSTENVSEVQSNDLQNEIEYEADDNHLVLVHSPQQLDNDQSPSFSRRF